MKKWVCSICGYVYGDEAEGEIDLPDFEELGEDYVCPLCGAGREEFEQTEI